MKSTEQLQAEYWKCFRPIIHAMKTKKIVAFKNRPPFKEWLIRISKNQNYD